MHFDGEGVNLKETLEKKPNKSNKKNQTNPNHKQKSSRRCQPEGEAQKNQTNPTKKSHKSNKLKSQAKKEGVNLKEKLNNSWVTSPARSHKGCRSPWTIPEISKLEKFK